MNFQMRAVASTAVVAATVVLVSGAPARAWTDCRFDRRGNTLVLRGDCRTDETLFVPDGATLEGARHSITAIDPPGGSFEGGVIQNAGTVAHVRRVVVRGEDLVRACHPREPEDRRVRG